MRELLIEKYGSPTIVINESHILNYWKNNKHQYHRINNLPAKIRIYNDGDSVMMYYKKGIVYREVYIVKGEIILDSIEKTTKSNDVRMQSILFSLKHLGDTTDIT